MGEVALLQSGSKGRKHISLTFKTHQGKKKRPHALKQACKVDKANELVGHPSLSLSPPSLSRILLFLQSSPIFPSTQTKHFTSQMIFLLLLVGKEKLIFYKSVIALMSTASFGSFLS